VDVPAPEPGPEEVVVQVLAAGVCRTDLHLLEEVKAGARGPLVPGHEIAGRVTKRGGEAYAVHVGDLVAVHFEQPCGQCRQCRRKRTNLCREGHALGFSAPGGYAEYVKAHHETVLGLAPGLDVALAAPLGCSGATAYRAVATLGRAEEGDVVVIVGAGGVGLSAVQVARVRQAKVLAVDPREEARTAAEEVGADAVADPEGAEDALRSLVGELGADVVVDLVGTGSSLERSRGLLGFGGRLVVVAPGRETIDMAANDLVHGGKAYLGAYSSTMADFARAVDLAEAGRLKPVVTRRVPLAQAAQVLEDLADGRIVGRAVLEPQAK
jgi:propanol-preferring alcohol dehydrogenase